MKMSKINSDYYPLGGGLDQLTPAIAMHPGKVISSQNFEPEVGGGYRRTCNYERDDGRALPSSKSYWIAAVTLTGTVAVGDTITGLTSSVTSKVLFQYSGYLVLGAVSGTYTNGETISNGASVGTIGTVSVDAAALPSDHADYKALAADLWRTTLAVVPGSGRIRGVWYYNNTLYAFRDNAGGTAGDMYKATTGGWSKITFGSEIQFTGAVGEIFAGDTITGGTSGATALVVKPMLRAGTWTVSGVGTLIISTITGTWQNGEAIKVTAVTKATSASLATSITRAAGGTMEFVNANFTGSTATKKMYGVDGVNKAFEFDGTNYIPIRTGMTTDTPTHICSHKNYLGLSFLGSHQFSGLGAPYSWTAVLGASEITTGDPITGYMTQSGDGSGASLAIFTEGKTYILYGSSLATFSLVPSNDDIGAFSYMAQSIGNDGLLLTNRGVQRLKTTLKYGNFEYASVSHLVQPLITSKRGLQTASITSRTKNQCRFFFSDNTAVVIGLTGDKISGIMPLDYGIPVRCVCTGETSAGVEVTWFGSDDGYVYRDNSGTSQDGDPITAWIRLSFNHLKTPRVRKRYRSSVIEMVADGYAEINVTYDLGYGNVDLAQGVASTDMQVLAAGAFWDSFTWDSFTWDSQAVGNPRISLDGIEKNISLLFYSSRSQDDAFTLQGITINTTPVRLEN